jgi:hypothetical protein
MLDLKSIIERIERLLAEDTDASVTYAALEARLALEKVCYDRLRQAHNYISHAQLRRWQPRDVVNTLLSDVDLSATTTRRLFMSKKPAVPGVKPDDDDFIEIGTEIGFDPKRIGVLWNALSNLALHVKLPTHKDDHITPYGDKAKIRLKVEEVARELERLSQGTMSFSGIGPEVSFVCTCGETNRRRAALLRAGQSVFCINPECKGSWVVHKDGDETTFESQTGEVNCERCGKVNHLPWRWLMALKYDQTASFSCHTCEQKNFIQWRLTQVSPTKRESAADG